MRSFLGVVTAYHPIDMRIIGGEPVNIIEHYSATIFKDNHIIYGEGQTEREAIKDMVQRARRWGF